MKKRKQARRKNRHKSKLGLPDLEHVKSAVLVSLRSPESQRSYRRSIDDFVCWYCSEPVCLSIRRWSRAIESTSKIGSSHPGPSM